MASDFDPYYRWLGIPPEEQPADHYRLLGIRRLETDPEVISNASDQRMAHLRTFASGKRGPESQRLLNEVAAATRTLLDTNKRREYDAQLQAQTTRSSAPWASAMPVAQAIPMMPSATVPVSYASQPAGVPLSAQPVAPFANAPAPMAVAAPPLPVVKEHRPARRRSNTGLIVGAASAALVLFVLPVTYFAMRSSVPEVVDNPVKPADIPPPPSPAPQPMPVPPAKAEEQQPATPKTEAEKPASPASAKPPAAPVVRTAWYYPVGPDGKSRGIFRRIGRKRWRQDATDRVFQFEEVETTGEYVALRETQIHVIVRLYADRLEFSNDNNTWKPGQKGQWVPPSELAAVLNNLKPQQEKPIEPVPAQVTPVAPTGKEVNVTRLAFTGNSSARLAALDSPLENGKPFTIQCWFRRMDNLQSSIGLVRCGDLNVILGAGTKDGLAATWCELNAGRWKSTFYRQPHDLNWHHFALASDGKEVRVYFDGKPYHNATLESLEVGTLDPIEFGSARSQYGPESFTGELHSLQISSSDQFTTGGFSVPPPRESELFAGSALELRNVTKMEPRGPRTSLADLTQPGNRSSSPPAERFALPDAAAQEEAKTTLASVYGDQIKKATKSDDKAKLAAKLLEVAESDSAAASSYALLGEAKRLAVLAGDVDSAIKAVDQLYNRFVVDREQEMTGLLKELSARSLQQAQRERLVQEGMACAQAALDQEDIQTADALATVTATAAGKGRDAEQKRATRQLREHVSLIKAAWDAKEEGLQVLQDSPDSPAANLAVGKYYAFSRSDFAKAAPYLAKSGQQNLASAAEKELAADDDAARLSAVEAWYALADDLKAAEKLALQRYVLAQCEEIAGRLTGLPKAQAEKHINELKPILAEAEKSNPSLAKPAKFQPGLIGRLLVGSRRNQVPTPHMAVVRSEQDLFRLNNFQLLEAYPSRIANFVLMGVVVAEKDTQVSFYFSDCNATLAGRPIQNVGMPVPLNKGVYPIIIVSTSSTPRFSVDDADTSESLLFHSERDLETELSKAVPVPTGGTSKGQLVE